MKIKHKIIIALLSIVLVSFIFAGLFLYAGNTEHQKYMKVLNSPPSYNYIEEDMETYLVSKCLEVLNHKQENDQIFYTVRIVENDHLYLVMYEIKRYEGVIGSVYKWEYRSHRFIRSRV